ncbi:uncharacterized protein LOC115761865 isoform X1 [Drosophila novamexicana]|uniref:uncharacterized protein LOC115761865 isoform X1 n=1 Tax=Drosophila novamexicana TaxID=47314 RepID=UPI0011E5BD40|nr:uncharacterized protein LOC115761865 isoform X1 [Drosophila novamexicana]
MLNLSGSLKPSGRNGATTSTAVRMEGSSCSMPPTAQRRRKKHSRIARVSAGALAPAINLPLPVRPGSTLTAKADGGFRKGDKGIASSSGVKSARIPPSSNLAESQDKKTSLLRKSAGATETSNSKGGRAEASGSRKVKFSANVHTFPSNTSNKKARIGELHLKKRIKKLKRNHPRSALGDKSVANKIDLSITQQPNTVLSRDVQHYGTIIDVEPVSSARGRKSPCEAPKAPVAGTFRKPKQLLNKKVKKPRIKAGASNRQPIVVNSRPAPRLAYSIQPNVKRDTFLPISRGKNKPVSGRVL